MLNLVLPVAVLAMLLLFVAQVRRLVAHAILNRTIRKALELDPVSARLLIAKVEPRPRWPDALAGWVLVVAGIAIAGAGAFDTTDERSKVFQIAALAVIVGSGVLLYAWWVYRLTPRSDTLD